MAVLSQDFKRSGHWYTRDGHAAHDQQKQDGSGERKTTIKDAKRLGLLPSVTSILKTLAAPGLERWRLNQAVLASERAPRQPDEGESYWCKRVCDAAFEQVDDAAVLGSRVHGALEVAVVDEPYDEDLQPYITPYLAWKQEKGLLVVEREICLVNAAEGFAGTADLMVRYGQAGIGILDYKTKKTKPGEKVEGYPDQAMQLAAYAATYWGEENLDRVLAANVFISTTEPGRFEVVKHGDLRRHWEAFKLVAGVWRYLNNYDPRVLA